MKMNKALIFIGLSILISPMGISSSQSIGGVVLTDVAPRIVTPNGDALNDVVFFKFDSNLAGIPIESQIVDISGAKVANLEFNSNETALLWNGKDTSGNIVPAGIYIYSIIIGKK
ncbi:MAG: gliding motility-associated C-terminal domain-containing protein, partial [Elusimicrobiota bacterium]